MLADLDTLIAFSVYMLGVSLLITILNQVVSSLFAHRGSNLRWGLKALFNQISPGAAGLPILAAHAELLAETVLTHPLASDSTFSTLWAKVVRNHPFLLGFVRRWQLANAIQPDDLAAILSHIATNRPQGMSSGLHAMLSAEINRLLGSQNAMAVRQGQMAAAVLVDVPPRLVSEAVDVVETASGNLEAWFNKIGDRVSQRFTMWMRIWTVLFAFAISITLCLDSVQLLSDLYRNSNLRSQLVAAAPQVTDIAKTTLPPGFASNTDAVSKDVTRMYTEALKKTAMDAGIADAPPEVSSSDKAYAWINQHIPDTDKAAEVRGKFDSNWAAQMTSHVQQALLISKVLTASDLPKLGWDRGPDQPTNPLPLRWLGVLASALLLSLGAPFWYNALATLTSLRPVLVSKQQSQDQAKLAKQAQPSN
jgi:hypothetical protein